MASHPSYHHYNRNLQPLAKKLRKELTKAEACLWKYGLRAKKLRGYQFNRQRPVLHYIADFMCKELMLIIEVDGYIHNVEESLESDRIRQTKLEAVGFTILRFTNEEVLTKMGEVIYTLESWIDEYRQKKKMVFKE